MTRPGSRGRSHPIGRVSKAAAALAVALATAQAGCDALPGRLACARHALYDPAPLLPSIREADRGELAALAGLESLTDLPLYTIDVDLDTGAMAFVGTEELLFTNRTGGPLPDLVLRLYPNAYGQGAAAGQTLTVSEVSVDGAPTAVEPLSVTATRVALAAPLAPGETARLALSFQGRLLQHDEAAPAATGTPGLEQLLATLAGGEARGGDYGIYGAAQGIANMGLWYPRLADHGEGGWDRAEPSTVGDISALDLASYRVTIRTPADVAVAATGTLEREGEAASAPGRVQRTYVAAAVRSFAFQASSRYASSERQVGDVVVRSTYDRAHATRGARVLDVAAASLEVFERRFGRYPYADLDAVEAPLRGGAGGVEWPGLVTISRALYEDQPGAGLGGLQPSPLAAPTGELWAETLEFVVAHEVAHQYWSAAVGSDSRLHPYVDEALAQFSAALYFEDRYGPERGRQALDRQARMSYHVYRLLGGADGPVDRPADRFASTMEYAGLVYGKGPYFYRALRDELGEGAFSQGLRAYFERYRFRVAGPSALPAVMGEVSANQPAVDALVRRWLVEAHGDEDLGPATLAAVLEPVLGPDAAALLREASGLLAEPGGLGGLLDSVLRQLGAGPSPGPSSPGAGTGLGGLLDQILGGAGAAPVGPGAAPSPPQPAAPVPAPSPAAP